MNDTPPLPSLFVGHGSPMMALESDEYTRSLRRFGRSAANAKAIVVVSAHWEQHLPVRVTAAKSPGLIYDFYGFPKELYELQYPAPGDPQLATTLAKSLSDAGLVVEKDERRGLDHGCWVPLLHAFPQADLPVLQVSVPRPSNPEDLVELGRRLQPLRRQGILLVGSGNVVHNLRLVNFDKDAPIDPWAREFDQWFRERLEALDADGAARYRTEAPHARLAVPTPDHYDPALVTLGSALPGEQVHHVFEGIYNANISMRTFAVGGAP